MIVMMLYPSLNDMLENVNSRYLLVNVIAKRARQIAADAESEERVLGEKPVKMAIDEIADGKIIYNLPAEQ